MQPPADATRIRALRVYRRHPQQHAIAFVNYVKDSMHLSSCGPHKHLAQRGFGRN